MKREWDQTRQELQVLITRRLSSSNSKLFNLSFSLLLQEWECIYIIRQFHRNIFCLEETFVSHESVSLCLNCRKNLPTDSRFDTNWLWENIFLLKLCLCISWRRAKAQTARLHHCNKSTREENLVIQTKEKRSPHTMTVLCSVIPLISFVYWGHK